MSNYIKGEWCKIWDSLYYHFIYNHRDLLKKIYDTSMQVKHWDNKTQKEKDEIIKNAKVYIKNLINS
jgi:deoxyribodipyrimidine photolyase-like uncharacterized protein